MFSITVWETDEHGHRVDLAHYVRASIAPEAEDIVTRLHQQYPTPAFVVDVET